MWIVSADIGQAKDPTAIVALETSASFLDLRHVERLPLGTSYPGIVQRLAGLRDALPPPRDLVIDGTGVGRPVFDMLRAAGVAPIAVSIMGKGETRLGEDGLWRVAKMELVRALATVLESGHLRIAEGLPLGAVLMKEL